MRDDLCEIASDSTGFLPAENVTIIDDSQAMLWVAQTGDLCESFNAANPMSQIVEPA